MSYLQTLKRRIRSALWALCIGSALMPLVASAAISAPELVSGAQLYDRSDDEFAAAIIIDEQSGKRLYAYKPDLVWPAASLSKLMTALVVIEHHPSWSTIVSIKSQDEVGGGRLRVKSGSTMSVQDLFYSSIVGSANNATMALSRLSGLGTKGFVKQMNAKATELGLTNTSFQEPSGMNPKNVTTATDMAVLARKAFASPTIRRAATTAEYRFFIRSSNELKKITSTNALLTSDPDVWVMGGKTGFLYESRYNLVVKLRPTVASTQTPPLLVVVLGSPTKEASFATAKGLANWAWKAYKW